MTFELYDRLIEGIDESIIVDSVVISSTGAMVFADTYMGTAGIYEGETPDVEKYEGMTLKSLAELSKSWNFVEAGVGVAAINAWYNAGQHLDHSATVDKDTFAEYEEITAGKKVALIGSFSQMDGILTKADTYIIERYTKPGEYPEAAAEYLLPEMDYIFITGSTLVNKTMPRLLDLARDDSQVILLGPSSTLSEILFEYGVDEISGVVITNALKAMTSLISDDHKGIYKAGVRTRIQK